MCKPKLIKIISLDKIKNKDKQIKFIFGDLCDYNLCKEITKNIDIISYSGYKGSVKVTIEKPSSFLVPWL